MDNIIPYYTMKENYIGVAILKIKYYTDKRVPF